MLEFHSIGMTTKAICRFVEVDFMIGTLECPQRSKSGAAAANDCYLFLIFHFREIEREKESYMNKVEQDK